MASKEVSSISAQIPTSSGTRLNEFKRSVIAVWSGQLADVEDNRNSAATLKISQIIVIRKDQSTDSLAPSTESAIAESSNRLFLAAFAAHLEAI